MLAKLNPRKGNNCYNWIDCNLKCPICGKVFHVKPSHKDKKKYCSVECMVIAYRDIMSLHGNPNWRGGKSFEPYPLGWTKIFKEQIRQRDGYKCCFCGIPEVENGRRLDVHHKDYNKDNINPDNLISLCRSCHTKTNFNREHWLVAKTEAYLGESC
jgi:hypothetical protein